MDYEEILTFRKSSLAPKIDETGTESDGISSKAKLISILDDIDTRVEKFRRGALFMEEERDFLFSTMDGIRSSELLNDLLDSDKEHIFNYVERVTSRCGTVEVSVRTERNELEEESLYQVNVFINNLVADLKNDPLVIKDRCMSCMEACGSRGENYDKHFESILLGCTLDDQNRVKRRLQGLLNYIDCNYEVTSANDS